MRSNYKRLGDYIQSFDIRSRNHPEKLTIENIKGISSISKSFVKTKANLVGVSPDGYKVVEPNCFAYNPNTARMGDKIPIALNKYSEPVLVSSIYPTFKIKNEEHLLSDYLLMWFKRPEFDRYSRYKSQGSAREIFDWAEMCEVEFPVPSIEKQKELVAEYQTIENRMRLNNELCQKLEETAQTVYRHWFEDFEFPVIARSEAQQNDEAISTNQILQVAEHTAEYQNRSELVAERNRWVAERSRSYKSSGGEMIYSEELGKEIPKGWKVGKLGNISSLKYGKMLDSDEFLESGYPVFSGYGVRGYYHKYMYVKPQILVLCRGVSGTGEVRLSPPFSYITNLSIIVDVDQHQNEISKAFLFYYLKNENLRKLDSGSAQSQITIGDLENYHTLIPTKNCQIEFTEIFEQIDKRIGNLEEQNQKLEELKSLLLGKMAVER